VNTKATTPALYDKYLLLQDADLFTQDIVPDGKQQLFTIDAYMPGSINSYGNLASSQTKNRNFNITINYNCFVCFPVQHKHKKTLPIAFLKLIFFNPFKNGFFNIRVIIP
jgi:hypothetical protein